MTKSNHSYQIVSGPDNVFWVPLQPLLADLRRERAKTEIEGNYLVAQKIDIVIAFVDSLISEGLYNQYKDDVETLQ